MPVRRRIATAIASLAVTAAGLVATSAAAGAWPTANLELVGHGEGDGVGMSQDGAFGYATRYGWNYQQILGHYYGGSIRTVGLAPITVDLDQGASDGVESLQVTSSGAAFRIDGITIPAGGAAMLTHTATGGYQVRVATAGCHRSYGAARTVRSTTVSSTVAAPSALTQLLQLCDGWSFRGSLSLVPGRPSRFSLHTQRVVNRLSMDDYLLSVVALATSANQQRDPAEKPAWLQAQAIASRSLAATSRHYSWANVAAGDAGLFYQGAGPLAAPLEDARSRQAVQSTSSQVVVNQAGTSVAHTVYCLSSGGWTSGGSFPVVQDAGDVVSQSHDWSAAVPLGWIHLMLGADIGTLRQVSFTRTGVGDLGGRVRTMTLRGDQGSITISGADAVYHFGLKSDWFAISTAPPAIHLSNGSDQLAVTYEGAFGIPGDRPFACDFDGDGRDTVGVYRASTGMFYIRNSLGAALPYYEVKLGTAGDLPVCGDWNGDGVDTVGVYDPRTSRFYLINSVTRSASTPLIQVQFGGRGFQPIAGDWNGDHRATLGVWDPVQHYLYLINSLVPGAARSRYSFGGEYDTVFAGDFGRYGHDGYGAYNSGSFRVVDTAGQSNAGNAGDYGRPFDIPLVGDWNGDGTDSVGYATGY